MPEFINNECEGLGFSTDATTLNKTHRHGEHVAKFASSIFPEYTPVESCSDSGCCYGSSGDHLGIFAVLPKDRTDYIIKYGGDDLRILKWSGSQARKNEINFGQSKGQEYRRVLIDPTNDMKKFLESGKPSDIKSTQARAKFYVAVTRAIDSVAIIYDYNDISPFSSLVRKWSK